MTQLPPSKSLQATAPPAHIADPVQDTWTVVRLKDDAEGVLSSLPFTVLTAEEADAPSGPRPIAWLHVKTPYRRTPTARSTCACGRDHTARGDADVRDLIDAHDYHRTVCPLRTAQEGRNAA
ncbi:hypothetical protein ACWGH5_33345 [Streptomyces sp. NPDC054864]